METSDPADLTDNDLDGYIASTAHEEIKVDGLWSMHRKCKKPAASLISLLLQRPAVEKLKAVPSQRQGSLSAFLTTQLRQQQPETPSGSAPKKVVIPPSAAYS
jgi:hypothetical protein